MVCTRGRRLRPRVGCTRVDGLPLEVRRQKAEGRSEFRGVEVFTAAFSFPRCDLLTPTPRRSQITSAFSPLPSSYVVLTNRCRSHSHPPTAISPSTTEHDRNRC